MLRLRRRRLPKLVALRDAKAARGLGGFVHLPRAVQLGPQPLRVLLAVVQHRGHGVPVRLQVRDVGLRIQQRLPQLQKQVAHPGIDCARVQILLHDRLQIRRAQKAAILRHVQTSAASCRSRRAAPAGDDVVGRGVPVLLVTPRSRQCGDSDVKNLSKQFHEFSLSVAAFVPQCLGERLLAAESRLHARPRPFGLAAACPRFLRVVVRVGPLRPVFVAAFFVFHVFILARCSRILLVLVKCTHGTTTSVHTIFLAVIKKTGCSAEVRGMLRLTLSLRAPLQHLAVHGRKCRALPALAFLATLRRRGARAPRARGSGWFHP
mmetsp:Transcript_4055/g.9906  ORF Transcript_4055/g.9906 Transcript_4055/m.9906 type:complete len:320 (-) Transcript_4055:582-1541(-)